MPMKWRPSRRATAAVVPLPRKGSRMISPGAVQARITRCNRASGFWVGCSFTPESSRNRSWPVQSGMNQSLRICTSSFSAFICW